jgi:hypothetical protein
MKTEHLYKNYNNVHMWLKNHFGKASMCESGDCLDGSKRFEWALKKGREYDKIRENFIMLCSKCHKKYDGLGKKVSAAKKGVPLPKEVVARMIQSRKGKPCFWNRKPVICLKDSVVVYEFESVKAASVALKIERSSISNCVNGRSKTSGGYQWKYKNEDTR